MGIDRAPWAGRLRPWHIVLACLGGIGLGQMVGLLMFGVWIAPAGFVALRTRSVWPAVAAHAATNLLWAIGTRIDPASAGNMKPNVPYAIASLVLSAVAIAVLLRITRPPSPGRERPG
jgi:membrane protease YdiL (CAAX protease family)